MGLLQARDDHIIQTNVEPIDYITTTLVPPSPE